ncbi:unnamed protein product [Cuscuta campestris]|uniref:Peptidase A1 domain-containing protein n=1 Tax=Cuscuta campestris TaxID=132261 RepID=A0A484LVL9_9ASTE|nr:unnamed protein product [Cuscuta campestris]
MAYNFHIIPLLTLSFLAVLTLAQRPFFPRAIVLPVAKDLPTSQYLTRLQIGQNLHPLKLVVDLGGPFLWTDHTSPSLGSVLCKSLKCSMANSSGCTSNQICPLQLLNPVSKTPGSGFLKEDSIALELIDDPNGSSFLSHVPNFLFSSVPSFLLQGLGRGVDGVFGLGNSRISLPSQLASTFGLPRKFSICLSSSKGSIFSGDLPPFGVARSMMYTPLILPRNSTSPEYHINVTSIRINGERQGLKQGSLSDQGTKISTIVPYTTMNTAVYQAFVESYIGHAASKGMTQVDPVAPFGVCFKDVAGWDAPRVDLVLQSEMMKWRMNGVVKMGGGVVCLGFLDGGSDQIAPIVIGGYQLEDNLLEFNLGTSMLGFTSLMPETNCSYFSRISWSRD